MLSYKLVQVIFIADLNKNRLCNRLSLSSKGVRVWKFSISNLSNGSIVKVSPKQEPMNHNLVVYSYCLQNLFICILWYQLPCSNLNPQNADSSTFCTQKSFGIDGHKNSITDLIVTRATLFYYDHPYHKIMKSVTYTVTEGHHKL